jgi:hypothetical protein
MRKCAKNSRFLNEFFPKATRVYRLRKSALLKTTGIPSARLQSILNTLPTNLPYHAIVSNRMDISRVPKFIISGKTPTILPSLSRQINVEQQKQAMKRVVKRKRLQKLDKSTTSKLTKKPNILRSSNVKEKSVRLGSIVRATNASIMNSRLSSIPDSKARPTKSILSRKRTRQQSNAENSQVSEVGRMNRLSLARKIVKRGVSRQRFFGILGGWRRLYRACFQMNAESKRKLTFEHNENLELGTLLSSQSENVPDPQTDPLPNPLSPDYFKRINPQLVNFPINSLFNSNSFGLQNVSSYY